MKFSEIIRWKTYRILYLQRRWNKLSAKGYCAEHICARLGLTPGSYPAERLTQPNTKDFHAEFHAADVPRR